MNNGKIFYPGQLVLVRGGGPKDIDPRVWRVEVFSFQRAVDGRGADFFAGSGRYRECVPLEGNESLVGSACAPGEDKKQPAFSFESVVSVGEAGSVSFSDIFAELTSLRAQLRQKSAQVDELKEAVCKAESGKTAFTEMYKDSESARRGLEQDIIALLEHENPVAGDFLRRVVCENRELWEERANLLAERDRILKELSRTRLAAQVGRVVEETDTDVCESDSSAVGCQGNTKSK